ncbi:MAG: hypothetical protein AABY07_10340, partial [Nanoarchaeota archaeon]
MISKISEEIRICDLVRITLRLFPFYENDHNVSAYIHDGGTSISYRTKRGINRESIESTCFDIQISYGTCYIMWISIDAEKRGNGYGRSL